LNTANNNFLEGTNYNYSYTPVISPGKCKRDYMMLELRTINSISNMPSGSMIVILPIKKVTLITNYCSVIKSIKNIKTQSIEIKSLSGTCEQIEGVERYNSNCSDKDPIESKPKEQGFDEVAEIVFDRTETEIKKIK
jgi:hypothetical protein